MVAIPRRIKRTSRLAYEGLVASGQLKGKCQRILSVLTEGGPATSGEVIDEIIQRDHVTLNVNAERGRFTELQARGLIRQIGERPCKISGRLCIVWAPTGRDAALDEGRKHVATSRAAEWQESARQWRELASVMSKLLEEGVGPSYPPVQGVLASYRALAKQERTRERRRGRS
jgi:hypothetical protein